MLIINGLFQNHNEDDEMSSAFYQRQRDALKQIPESLKETITYSLPYVSYSLTGVENLRNLFKPFEISNAIEVGTENYLVNLPGIKAVIEEFSNNGTKLIFTMGKGGVGKTTIASAIAVGLVEKGHRVHLTTTDPAAHLDYQFHRDQLNQNLTISSINPKVALEKLGKHAEVIKVADIREIVSYGVMTSPTLVIDDKVVSTGKVLKPKAIMKMLEQ